MTSFQKEKVSHFKCEFEEQVITCQSAECRGILSIVGMRWLELNLGQRVGVAYDECAVGLKKITISCGALWRFVIGKIKMCGCGVFVEVSATTFASTQYN